MNTDRLVHAVGAVCFYNVKIAVENMRYRYSTFRGVDIEEKVVEVAVCTDKSSDALAASSYSFVYEKRRRTLTDLYLLVNPL